MTSLFRRECGRIEYPLAWIAGLAVFANVFSFQPPALLGSLAFLSLPLAIFLWSEEHDDSVWSYLFALPIRRHAVFLVKGIFGITALFAALGLWLLLSAARLDTLLHRNEPYGLIKLVFERYEFILSAFPVFFTFIFGLARLWSIALPIAVTISLGHMAYLYSGHFVPNALYLSVPATFGLALVLHVMRELPA